jgi:phosphatidylglycerophosphatase A
MHFVSRLISTCLGLGYAPIAPGTIGALVTVVICWICPDLSSVQFFLMMVFVICLGILTASITEKEFQQKRSNKDLRDPGIIIIDEVAGMLVALVAIQKSILLFGAAFVLFRFFDIVKPYPIKKFEKLPSGWGIVSDDVIAGLFANVILRLVTLIFY